MYQSILTYPQPQVTALCWSYISALTLTLPLTHNLSCLYTAGGSRSMDSLSVRQHIVAMTLTLTLALILTLPLTHPLPLNRLLPPYSWWQ